MNKIIYFISLVCFLIIFNIKDQLQLYYIQYNPSIVNINGYYVDSKNKNELYDKKTNDIIFISKVKSLINNKHLNFLYNNHKKFPNIIYKIKYDYTHNLTVNNEKREGSYIIITYPSIPNIAYIEKYIYNVNIIDIITQIIKYTKITNNNILFLDYFITTDTNNLYIKNFKENETQCDATIFNLIAFIKLILNNNKTVLNSKKQLYIIVGEISNLINNMKITVIPKNLQQIHDDNIFKNEFDPPLIIPTKIYNITGLDITDKSIAEIKKLIESKPNVPIVKSDFIKTNKIGDGLFSNVYKNGDKIIKILKQKKMFSSEYDEEIKTSKKINDIDDANKYFPKFDRVFLCKINNEYNICLEYEYIGGSTLSRFSRKDKNIGNTSIKKIINNIIKGNNFLNKNGIKRIDNHSNNIIVQKNHEIKYIDFGRTYIIENPYNYQLDNYKYFKLHIQTALNILQSDLSKKKSLLNLVFTEFLAAISNLEN